MIARSRRCGSIAGRRLGKCRNGLGGIELEEVSLAGSLDQPLAAAEDVAAIKLNLLAQFINELVVLLNGLVVKLGALIERSPEILNLLGETIQEIVTFARIGRP